MDKGSKKPSSTGYSDLSDGLRVTPFEQPGPGQLRICSSYQHLPTVNKSGQIEALERQIHVRVHLEFRLNLGVLPICICICSLTYLPY